MAYSGLGAPSGPPVVHHHGAPSGKLETAFFNLGDAAAKARVRLLAETALLQLHQQALR
ncbi:hypothetical protein [Arthrobacter sp.]|uniref:hypothetical protein n=1 Tax=Arthrobacter sp. TaxID=1667 RepID=UPI00339730F0